jgi:hypothetical protein
MQKWPEVTAAICVWVTAIALFIAGCETKPIPFETGPEVSPPGGCIEGRERGVDC